MNEALPTALTRLALKAPSVLHLTTAVPTERMQDRPRGPPVGNEFQNLERARKRFLELGINPFDGVSESDLILLMDCIQKRHVIGHNLGMTDGRYLSLTHTEEGHQLGESVQVLGVDIGRFAEICLSVVGDLERALLPESQRCPPNILS